MTPIGQENTTFLTEKANFYYEVMSFSFKNAGATYQRLMDRMFREKIGKTMEVYVDDMIVKSDNAEQHAVAMAEIFKQLKHYDMRLNP